MRAVVAGKYNLCPQMSFFATPPVDGAFADFVAVPSRLAFAVPDSLSDDAAALLEPLPVGIGRWVPDHDDYPALGELLEWPGFLIEAELARLRSWPRWLRDDLAARDRGDQERRRTRVHAVVERVADAIGVAACAKT